MSEVTDWKTPGTCANVDRDGKMPWVNPDYAKISNNFCAGSSVAEEDYSDWLRCTNFGFTTDDVPNGATIVGIEVKIERKADFADFLKDSAVYLRDSVDRTGDNKATATLWPESDTEETHGASDDDWNAELSDADIRDSSFGVDISAYNTWDVDNISALIDCVSIRVHYTTGAAGWAGKISGVVNPAKVMGVAVASIKSIKGVE